MRRAMIQQEKADLSISKQCKLLYINRSNYYYQPKGENESNLAMMHLIDQEYMKYPFFGSRQMRCHLNRMGHVISRHRVRRLMRKMGIMAIYQKPRTTVSNSTDQKYPYLLRGLDINRPNQVWCTDITYIPIKRGFLYLTAIKDWYSRRVLTWRLSNTLDASFCVLALEEAIYKYGTPKIFNSDQGSQYTSCDFIAVLKLHKIKISMDGKGRCMDNIFIERLWRSLKYECVYLQEFENGLQAKKAISNWIDFYNYRRPHSTFNGLTPDEVYSKKTEDLAA